MSTILLWFTLQRSVNHIERVYTPEGIMNYIANVGTDNATFLTTKLDRANGNRVAEDLEGGHVQISAEGLRILRDIGEHHGAEISDDENGIQLWIEGSAYPLVPSTSGAHTVADAAREFDTTPEVVVALIDQISYDADLYNAEAQTLTELGLALLRGQLATVTPSDRTLDELAEATAAFAAADERADTASAVWDQAKMARDEARDRRDAAIRAAVAYGHPKTRVAETADLSRQMLYRIIG